MNARVPGLTPAATLVEAVPPPCLIVNPSSFRVARGLAEPAIALARAHGAEVVQVDAPQTLATAVRSILARRQQRVMVLAGDGTVRAIVDQLATLPAGAWLPDLLVLPGGRTNLTAVDLVPRGDAVATLQRALRPTSGGDGAAVDRVVLRIEQYDAPARHGFFVAGALVGSIIRRIHAHRAAGSGPLATGRLSTVWGLLRLGALALRGRSGLACPTLCVDAGALGRLEGPTRLLLVTTLLHRDRLFDPYPSRGAGDVRIAAVAARAPRFWRSLPRLLTGRYAPTMDAASGYLGGRCERVKITGLDRYWLDGEAFDADPQQPLCITAGPRLRFLVP